MEQEKIMFDEKRKIKDALSIIRTHYYRCISTSREDENMVDAQNARRVINEASFQESKIVLKALDELDKML